jgi:type I restriction enzyme S subunit
MSCSFISEYINNNIEFSVESTGVPQLTAPQISQYEILFPKTSEQNAIATILSDMDSELSVLEAKLSKYRTIKQGMMQELLTGKTRLMKTETHGGNK